MFNKTSKARSVKSSTEAAPSVKPVDSAKTPAVATAAAVSAPSVEVKPAVATVVATAIPPVATPKPVTLPTSTVALLVALRDRSADVAREAAISLGKARDLSAVGPLEQVVCNADNYFHPVVRAAAAESLGQLGDIHAVDALVIGTRDSMAEASAESVRALATLKDQRAVAPLIEIVRNTNHYYLPIVRRAAVMALIKLGGPQAIATIKAVIANTNEDPVIRQAAVDSHL